MLTRVVVAGRSCHLLVIEHGYCALAYLGYVWVLIPRVEDSYSVVFQKETINDRPALDLR